MKGLLKNKIFAIVISVLLVMGISPAAYAAPFNQSSRARIRVELTSVDIAVGEKIALVVEYDELLGLEDEDVNIYTATSSAYDPGVVEVSFGDNDKDIFTLEITGVANGKTTVYVRVGKYNTPIAVTVGKGGKTAETRTNQAAPVSSKSALENALDSAIKKSEQKDVMISTTSAKTSAITSATLKALAATAEKAGKRAIVRVDSHNSKGKIQARLYLDPASLVNLKSDFKTAITVDTSRKASLGSKYIASVKCAYTGSFGKNTEIAVKVNAPEDVSKLSFYNVDTKGNLKKIEKPSCSLDKSGILHFFTKSGGEIVIANGTL